ncbi:hypothetical protein BROUX41_004679 [Berkeleyomyces rouxiae]|uniref:uncharacterized protein n=1 Tax=Berkeleyomyces rouxiae TaxID=2035830 RepID=UPI003B80AA5F
MDLRHRGYPDRGPPSRHEMLERPSFNMREPYFTTKKDMLAFKRPESVVTEFVDVDWVEEQEYNNEDDASSEYEGSVRNSLDSGSKSMTTVSSYDEASTPRSSTGHEVFTAMHGDQIDDADAAMFYSRPPVPKIRLLADASGDTRPVEGPRGPHLFHLNTSAFQTEEYVLSLSPLTPMAETKAVAEGLVREVKNAPWPDFEFERPGVRSLEAAQMRTHIQAQPQMQQQIVRHHYFTGAELDPLKLALWSPAMVAQSMLNVGVEMNAANKFIEHDIDGTILSTLKFQDLKELGILSFGMRTIISNQIKVLCSLKPASPVPLTPIDGPITAIAQNAGGSRLRATPTAALPTSTPILKHPGPSRRPSRRHRTPRNGGLGADDVISPLESISIVGIEQVIPKPHHCAKGERCSKFRKQKRLIEQFRREHPEATELDGHNLLIAGDPGNPDTAPRLGLCSPITPTVMSPITDFTSPFADTAPAVATRPSSDAVPSVVASSDVLGPGMTPKMQPYLQAEVLNTVKRRDPQDNVKQFIDFQRVQTNVSSEVPPTPPFEIFPMPSPKQLQPNQRLRTLPRLAIPGKPAAPPIQQQQPLGNPRRNSIGRSGLSQVTNVEDSPANQSAKGSPQPTSANNPTFTPYTMEKASPLAQELVSPSSATATTNPFRFGTPFSEMDVPVTHVSSGPVARDTSQSVPPEMKLNHSYSHALPVRSQSRSSHRRPSFSVMPAVDENRATPPVVKPGPVVQLPVRGLVATSTPPAAQGAVLKAPPRFNYPWSPIERKIPFETAIPPAPKAGGPVTVAATTATSTSSSDSAASSSQTSLSPIASSNSSTTSTTKISASGVTYQGPMKKRRTHFLRHEWQDGFFTLKGTRLAMHRDAASTQRTLEYVDIDDYAVACSSLASQSKLAAKFKVASIRRGGSDKPKDDVASFSFQLVPADKSTSHATSNGLAQATMSSGPFGGTASGRFKKRLSGSGGISASAAAAIGLATTVSESTPTCASTAALAAAPSEPEPAPPGATNGTGKTHHFAVKSRNQQMGWMRELMLAKAMKQKGQGFEVRINGNAI